MLHRADDLIRAHGQYYDQMWRLELTYSRLYWQAGNRLLAARKLRSAIRYRNLLRLPATEFGHAAAPKFGQIDKCQGFPRL